MTSGRDTEKEWNKKLLGGFSFLKEIMWTNPSRWQRSQDIKFLFMKLQLSILKLLNQPEFRVAGQPDVHVSQHWERAGELEIDFFCVFLFHRCIWHPLPCRVTAPEPIRAASCPLGPQAVITKWKPSTSVRFLREVAAAPLFTSAPKECAQIYCC